MMLLDSTRLEVEFKVKTCVEYKEARSSASAKTIGSGGRHIRVSRFGQHMTRFPNRRITVSVSHFASTMYFFNRQAMGSSAGLCLHTVVNQTVLMRY